MASGNKFIKANSWPSLDLLNQKPKTGPAVCGLKTSPGDSKFDPIRKLACLLQWEREMELNFADTKDGSTFKCWGELVEKYCRM